MTDPLPYADLDNALTKARYLLLDFDGPICDLYAGQPAGSAAGLQAALATYATEMPADAQASAVPHELLSQARDVSAELARHAEAAVTRHELDAVASAEPTGYVHDVISSAREGRRTVAALGTCSAQAINAYLASARLEELVDVVIGRTPYTPVLTEHDLVAQALSALAADPAQCALVTSSASLIDAASSADFATIGYAPTPATRTLLADHASAAITSLADLVLRLRARPLPN